MRRSNRRPQANKFGVSIRMVFRGIYYRHEFARRKDAILTDGENVLSQLRIPPEDAEKFVSADKRTLTDRIIREYQRASAPERERAKPILKKYLSDWKVLPMTRSQDEFFPRLWDKSKTEVELFRLWNELFRFEIFCLGRLQCGTPALFPIMFIAPGKSTYDNLEASTLVDFRHYRYPLLTSLEMPSELIGAYLQLFQTQERIELHLSKDGIDHDAWHRIPWDDFDWTLKVYDWTKTLDPSKDPSKSYPDFYNTQRKLGVAVTRHSKKGPEKTSLPNECREHIRRATHWIENYSRII